MVLEVDMLCRGIIKSTGIGDNGDFTTIFNVIMHRGYDETDNGLLSVQSV